MSKQYRAWLLASAAAGAAAAGTAAAGLAPVALADKKDDHFFDPEALERGAKALREINKSPYAKQVCMRHACHLLLARLASQLSSLLPPTRHGDAVHGRHAGYA
jgi:hypothetical protein